MRRSVTGALCLLSTVVLSACGGGGGGGTIPSSFTSKAGTNGISAPAQNHIVYFTSDGIGSAFSLQPSIFAYNSSATGAEYPINTIVNPSALGITGLATDSQGNIYATYPTGGSGAITYSEIVEYSPSGSPIRTIAGSNTEIQSIDQLSVAADGTIFVLESAAQPGCLGVPHLLTFSATASGNVAPSRDITGSNTRLVYGELAVASDGTAYVSDVVSSQPTSSAGRVLVYGPSENGNAPPTAVIEGTSTQLGFIYSMTTSAQRLVVSTRIDPTKENSTVLEFPLASNGNVSPTKIISLAKTGFPVAVDSAGEYYLYFGTPGGVQIFAPDASGAAMPINTFTPTLAAFNGCNTCGFTGPMAVH